MQRNRAVTDTYEPGSTFKVVTYGAALSDGVVNPNSTLLAAAVDQGRRPHDRRGRAAADRDDERLGDARAVVERRHGDARAAARVEAACVVDQRGSASAHSTGIDFPGESPGIVLPLDHWSGSTIGNVPIGQGIAVTPIQMAALYGALANGGVLGPAAPRRPRRAACGAKRAERHRVLSPRRRAELISMLQGVVSSEGTGDEAAVPGYLVAGKTGTAAKPDPARRLLGHEVRRVVRRDRAGERAAARHPRLDRRAAGPDLRRRRRRAGVPRHREVRAAVPGRAAGRPRFARQRRSSAPQTQLVRFGGPR